MPWQSGVIIENHPTTSGATMSWFLQWLRPSVRERLAPYNLRPDVLDAAAAMASDQRSDIHVARLESSLTDSETVLRMMDARYAGGDGPARADQRTHSLPYAPQH